MQEVPSHLALPPDPASRCSCGVRHVAHSMYLVFFVNGPDGEPRIDRAICMRGAETEAERAHFFDVLHRKHGTGPGHRRKSSAKADKPAANV
eukprot:352544-Chlamydomonas_euryale.AAC.25